MVCGLAKLKASELEWSNLVFNLLSAWKIITYMKMKVILPSLVPRPSPAPVFDHLQYGTMAPFLHTASDRKLEPGKAWQRG